MTETQDLTVGELVDIALNTSAVQLLMDTYPIDVHKYLEIIQKSDISAYVVRTYNDYMDVMPDIMDLLECELNEKEYDTLHKFKNVIDTIVYGVFEIICDSADDDN